MVSLPENPSDPISEAVWQILTLSVDAIFILTVITVDREGGQLDIETKNITIG